MRIIQVVSLLLLLRPALKTQEILHHFQVALTKQILRLHIQVDQDSDLVDHRVLLPLDLHLEHRAMVAIHQVVQHQMMEDHHHIQVSGIS